MSNYKMPTAKSYPGSDWGSAAARKILNAAQSISESQNRKRKIESDWQTKQWKKVVRFMGSKLNSKKDPVYEAIIKERE